MEKKIRDANKKISDISVSVTATVLNTKLSEIENKIPYVSDLVKKTDNNSKIWNNTKKCFITSDSNKFTSEI